MHLKRSQMKTTDVYIRNIKALASGSKYIVNQGSARSSKTFSILQALYYIASTYKGKALKTISVVSQTLPHLKRGAIRDFQIFMKENGTWDEDNWRRGDLIYTVGNTQIEFFSVDSPGKIYGAARDILFINEANRISQEIFTQLAIRTRKTIFIDYNPTHEFWAHTELIGRPDVAYIHSTFRDNEFIEPSIVNELIEAGKRNENFRRVFVEGEIGVIEGVVFDNWSEGVTDQELPKLYGQDFGFSKDPTTLIEVKIDQRGKKIYLRELLYQTGLNTSKIAEVDLTLCGQGLIIADSAEPRLISELQSHGINIRPAVKGQGSISAGIALMQNYDLVIHPDSLNLRRELKNYVYLDKGGQLVIDDFNHLIDAARYSITYYLDKQTYNPPITTYKLRATR